MSPASRKAIHLPWALAKAEFLLGVSLSSPTINDALILLLLYESVNTLPALLWILTSSSLNNENGLRLSSSSVFATNNNSPLDACGACRSTLSLGLSKNHRDARILVRLCQNALYRLNNMSTVTMRKHDDRHQSFIYSCLHAISTPSLPISPILRLKDRGWLMHYDAMPFTLRYLDAVFLLSRTDAESRHFCKRCLVSSNFAIIDGAASI